MSLTDDDIHKLRLIVREEITQAIEPIKGEISALRADIKEIYEMLAELQSSTITDKSFARKSLEDKLLTLNAELLAAAKQAGITLPRS